MPEYIKSQFTHKVGDIVLHRSKGIVGRITNITAEPEPRVCIRGKDGGEYNLSLMLAAHRQLKSEETLLNEQVARLEVFKGEPSPPDMATFKRLAEFWSGDIANELRNPADQVKAKFAELFDLHATIHPDGSLNGYHCNLSANIPLEMEGDSPGAYDMVFIPSRGGHRG